MTEAVESNGVSARAMLATLLIVVAVAAPAGRLLSTQRVYEPSLFREDSDPVKRFSRWPKNRPQPMPIFSANDRSRWATVRALVDEGTYVVGKRDRTIVLTSAVLPLGILDPIQAATLANAGFEARTHSDTGIITEEAWQSLDKVLHPDRLEFYSSKPPLLATLMAMLYWILQTVTGLLFEAPWTLVTHTDAVVRTLLFVVNIAPFFLYLRLLWGVIEGLGKSEWGKIYVLMAAGFGTLVTPFLITLNNHTIGTFCILFTLVSVLAVWRGESRRRRFLSAGFFASFAVCNELPALAFAVAVLALLLIWEPRRTLVYFLAAALIPAIAFFATNYLAVGQLRPAYSEFGNIWYEFEGGYWHRPAEGEIKYGIDWAGFKESRWEYAFHVLIGHHGFFSLTPIWLLSLWGMARAMRRTGALRRVLSRATSDAESAAVPNLPPPSGESVVATGIFTRNAVGVHLAPGPSPRRGEGGLDRSMPAFLAPLTLGVSIIVIAFYLVKSDNYGGWTSGLRWLMWLTPLWLVSLVPVADRLARSRMGRGIGYVLLAFSVLAVSYAPWNPWRFPYLYDLMVSMGWPAY